MKQFGKIMLTGLGLAVAAIVMSSIPAKPVSGAQSAPVMVTNTPLPVQGTVSVTQSGTWNVGADINPGGAVPSVNIDQMPAVNLGGSVNATVTNPAGTSGPVPLVTQDGAVQGGFTDRFTCSFGATSNTESCVAFGIGVPSNEIAVVQNASVHCNLDAGTQLVSAAVARGFASSPAPVDLTLGPPVAAFGGVVQAFGQNVTIYFPAGSQILMFGNATANESSGANCGFTVSGYFVPTQ